MEPLFLLHTGDCSNGEQDDWETEADSETRVDAFCAAHPGQTIALVPLAEVQARDAEIERLRSLLTEEVLAQNTRDDGRREWCSVGTWLYPGERVVGLRMMEDEPVQDLGRCPQCGGDADNGNDRHVPPTAYLCSKCVAGIRQGYPQSGKEE